MQRVKVLVVAVIAMLAVSALAVASASAEELVSLPKENTTFKGEGGKGALKSLGFLHEVNCEKQTSEGTTEGSKAFALGTVHIHFTGCSNPLLGTCTGLSDETGQILSLGTTHFVYDKLGTGSELGVGVLFLIEATHFTCGGVLFEVSGEYLCLISPLKTKTAKFTIKCTESGKGDAAETVYWGSAGKETKVGTLLTSENHNAGEASGETTEATITNNKEVTIDG